jgi:hypothetical protein
LGKHVTYIIDEHISKKALQKTINGRRAAGKPRQRWEDAIWEDSIKLFGMPA